MATSTSAVIPSMAKISIIGIWVETWLYGINCLVYGLFIFIVFHGEKLASVRWILVVSSTILMLLCTVHVGASLRQLLEAFVYVPANVPMYSTKYWLDCTGKLVVLKDNVFGTLMLLQDFIQIWRLYVVYGSRRRIVILPVIFALGCVGLVYAISGLCGIRKVGFHESLISRLVISACALDMTLNVSVTLAIAGRLWWASRMTASSAVTKARSYTTAIYVIIESGAIFAATNIAMLAVYASDSPGFLSVLDVASQLAVLTPLLIIVQVELFTARNRNSYRSSVNVLTTQKDMVFQERFSEDKSMGRLSLPRAAPPSPSLNTKDAHV